MKKKLSLIQIVRTVIQLIAFVTVPALFITIFSSIGSIIMSIIGGSFVLTEYLGSIILVLGVFLVTMVFGRYFCGFICSFGAMQDLLNAVGKLIPFKVKIPEKADKYLKLLKYVVLAFVAIGVWGFSVTGDVIWSPWTVFGAYVQPWKGVPTDALFLSVGGLLLLLIVIGSLFVERFFCKYICPLGAIFTAVSHFRLFRVRRKASLCPSGCRLCTQQCPMSIPLYTQERVCSGECIDCMKCTGVCPNDNITAEPIPAVSGTLAAAAFAGMTLIGEIPTVTRPDTSVYETESVQETDSGKYTDGVYTGSGDGYRGPITVRVTVENGSITDIEITSSRDDSQYVSRAQDGIIPAILAAQSTDISAVSGATFSSRGILRAVEDALSLEQPEQTETTAVEPTEPQTEPQTETKMPSGVGSYTDGVYTGSGSGFRGTTTVQVTVENGAITDITVTSYDDDPQFFSRAKDSVIAAILSAQSVDVDTVSGATFSSNSIREAVADALSVDFTNPNDSSEGRGMHGRHGDFGSKNRQNTFSM